MDKTAHKNFIPITSSTLNGVYFACRFVYTGVEHTRRRLKLNLCYESSSIIWNSFDPNGFSQSIVCERFHLSSIYAGSKANNTELLSKTNSIAFEIDE